MKHKRFPFIGCLDCRPDIFKTTFFFWYNIGDQMSSKSTLPAAQYEVVKRLMGPNYLQFLTHMVAQVRCGADQGTELLESDDELWDLRTRVFDDSHTGSVSGLITDTLVIAGDCANSAEHVWKQTAGTFPACLASCLPCVPASSSSSFRCRLAHIQTMHLASFAQHKFYPLSHTTYSPGSLV
jgi:hypothetical protein